VIRFGNVTIDRKAMTITVGSRVHKFECRRNPNSYSNQQNYFFKAVCYLLLNGWTRKQDFFDFSVWR
jgi:hypothetical protein